MSKKVLMIDDDPEFVDAISNLLDAKGYEVHTASNGKDGVAKAKAEDPDIILLDVMMTTNNEGFNVARELHEDQIHLPPDPGHHDDRDPAGDESAIRLRAERHLAAREEATGEAREARGPTLSDRGVHPVVVGQSFLRIASASAICYSFTRLN